MRKYSNNDLARLLRIDIYWNNIVIFCNAVLKQKETLTHEMHSCYNEKLTRVIEKNTISLNNSLNNNVVHDLETKARLVLRYAEMKLKNKK